MNSVNILLVTVVPVLVLAPIVGFLIGRHLAKKAAGQLKSLLSAKERIVYFSSVGLGIVLLLIGIFYHPANPPGRHPEPGQGGGETFDIWGDVEEMVLPDAWDGEHGFDNYEVVLGETLPDAPPMEADFDQQEEFLPESDYVFEYQPEFENPAEWEDIG